MPFSAASSLTQKETSGNSSKKPAIKPRALHDHEKERRHSMGHQPLFRSFRSEDLPEILRIQAANLVSNLSETERSDGFLSVAFSSRQFEEMNRDIPMVVADLGTRLAGYLCSSTLEYSRSIPLLSHMTGLFPEASFRGRTLDHYRSFFLRSGLRGSAPPGRGRHRGSFQRAEKPHPGNIRCRCIVRLPEQHCAPCRFMPGSSE